MTNDRQRLDKWLVYARLVKTRSLAVDLVEGGRIRVNRDRTRKASHSVGPGDVLTITLQGQIKVLRILACGERRGPAKEAQHLYEDLSRAADDGQGLETLGPAQE